MKLYDRIFLDKERDIVIEFYKDRNNYFYILRTPHHHSGNLITNLAKVCNLDTSIDENGLKIIKGQVPSFLNEKNERIHILKFNHKTIAVINKEGEILKRASIPAISKTLMSQSKDCNLSLDNVLIRTYIEEKYKFHTDVHTHMNACLYPTMLLALGIYHQIRYPYYYIRKLDLKLTNKQYEKLMKQRSKVAKSFSNSELVGKYRERRIDDNTFINFADLILNNPIDMNDNIDKILSSLVILKDGQAVFTNLEKLYLYRYVFTKGVESEKKIKLKGLNRIENSSLKKWLSKMLDDSKNELFKNNSLLEDKLLWIGRMYEAQGINYVEISNTTLVKDNDEPLEFLEKIHHILPLVEKETGVKIRFLAAIRRIPLTIIKDNITPENYLRINLAVLKAVAKDPYVVGVDFVGEEINEIKEIKPVIKEIVSYCKIDPSFTIRIHAGENDSLKDNVADSIKCVRDSIEKGQKMPKLRLGHGVYTPSLKTKKGKELLKEIKANNVVLEFQITSNVRLNNLSNLNSHPIKEYLKEGIKLIQGTDGCGIYGTDALDEQLASIFLLKLTRNDALKIIKTEQMIIDHANLYFKTKSRNFSEFLNGRTIKEAIKEEINKNLEVENLIKLNTEFKYIASDVLAKQIKVFPNDKLPIILAGGSFNSDKAKNTLIPFEKEMINTLLAKLNPKKIFFVVGHKINGYEKYLIEHKSNFEVYAIVPADISKYEMNKLIKADIPIRVSTESIGMGIYKSFNYWIFERRKSVLLALDGNSACANLIQEAKNGKAKSLIYITNNSKILKEKATSLKGYVNVYKTKSDVNNIIKNIKSYSINPNSLK